MSPRPDVAARNRAGRIVSYCRRCSRDRRRPSGRIRGAHGLCENCYQHDRRSR
jgi:hypothetical protein